MTLGGILYTAIPFNGWYADTEVLRGEKRVYCKAQYIVQQSKTDTQRLLSLVPCLVVICAVSVYYILCRLNWWREVQYDCTNCESSGYERRNEGWWASILQGGCNRHSMQGNLSLIQDKQSCPRRSPQLDWHVLWLVRGGKCLARVLSSQLEMGHCKLLNEPHINLNIISDSQYPLLHDKPPVSSSTNKAYLGLSHAQEYTLKPAYLVGKGFTELADVHFGKRTIELNWGLFLFRLQVKKWVSQIRARKMVCCNEWYMCIIIWIFYVYHFVPEHSHHNIYNSLSHFHVDQIENTDHLCISHRKCA